MLNVAVYGLGWWGAVLVKSVQGRSDKIRFTKGIVRDPAKYRDIAAQTGLSLTSSYDEVLRDPAIGAIVLAVPHTLHHDLILAAAKAGKHVFVEKPLALTRADAQSAVDACRAAGVTLGVGFNRRYAPAVQEMARRVRAGEIGDVLHLEGQQSVPIGFGLKPGNWRAVRGETPGGAMTLLGIHILDSMIHVAGLVQTVYATSERKKTPAEVDDCTTMHLRFASGATGFLASISVTAEFRRLQVFGTKGWIEIRSDNEITVKGIEAAPATTYRYPEADKERGVLEAFADAVAARKGFVMPAEELVNGIAVLEAIGRSAANGQPVQLR